MTPNLQRFSSIYSNSVLSHNACKCWTQLSLADKAARQWLLILVSHVVLYCLKRSIGEKEALLRQRSAIFVTVALT